MEQNRIEQNANEEQQPNNNTGPSIIDNIWLEQSEHVNKQQEQTLANNSQQNTEAHRRTIRHHGTNSSEPYPYLYWFWCNGCNSCCFECCSPESNACISACCDCCSHLNCSDCTCPDCSCCLDNCFSDCLVQSCSSLCEIISAIIGSNN